MVYGENEGASKVFSGSKKYLDISSIHEKFQEIRIRESLTHMESTHRIRRNLDEAYCLLRQSEALVGDLRQTIEHSWRLLERSYTILAKNKRSSEEPDLRNEDALRANPREVKNSLHFLSDQRTRALSLSTRFLAASNPAT